MLQFILHYCLKYQECFMSSMHKMSIAKYMKDILLVILFISVLSGFMPFIINKFMDIGFHDSYLF